jgi:hypothetical protein
VICPKQFLWFVIRGLLKYDKPEKIEYERFTEGDDDGKKTTSFLILCLYTLGLDINDNILTWVNALKPLRLLIRKIKY